MMSDDELVQELDKAATRVVETCSACGLTCATAESLTAGMVASQIAGVPGASEVLRGGAVTYVNEIKHRVLGVSQESLDTYTEVSHQVAAEMAEGARELFGCDIAVSLTGYAGPGGGTEENPVGTVYLGISDRSGTKTVRERFAGDRMQVRRQAALRALGLIMDAACDSE